MNDDRYVGSETLPPDTYLGPRRYKIVCQCGRCGKEFSWVTTKVGSVNRPCPRKSCKAAERREEIMREAANMAQIIEEQRAPGHIGDKVIVKAIDETAKTVMEDYGMTDLKDNLRMGDTMAPKLAPQMQHAADHMFDGGAVKGRAGVRNQRQAELLGRRAIAGAFRGMAINPGNVLPGQVGESALRLVGKEKLKDG